MRGISLFFVNTKAISWLLETPNAAVKTIPLLSKTLLTQLIKDSSVSFLGLWSVVPYVVSVIIASIWGIGYKSCCYWKGLFKRSWKWETKSSND